MDLTIKQKLKTKAPVIVQKLKCKEMLEKQTKVKCLDSDVNKVMEYLPCIKSGNPLEFFLNFVDKVSIL